MVNKKTMLYIIIIAIFIILLSFFLPGLLRNNEKIQKEAEAILQEAWPLLKEDKYQEASAEAQLIIDKYQKTDAVDDALFIVGTSQLQLKNYDLALSALEKIINGYPQSEYVPQALYMAASAYLQKEGNLEKAEEYLNIILKEYTESRELILSAKTLKQDVEVAKIQAEAESFFQTGNCDEATKKAMEAFDHPASQINDVALFIIGRCRIKTQNTEGALWAFEKIIQQCPQSKYMPESLYFAAGIYMQKGDKGKAEGYLDQILDNYPESENLVKLLDEDFPRKKEIKEIMEARDLVVNQKFQEALVEAKEVLEKYPENSADDALFIISNCHVSLGNYDLALQSLEQLINDYPESPYVPEAIYTQAIAYFYMTEMDKAKEYLNKILKEYPQSEEKTIKKTQELLNFLENIEV